MITGSRFLGAAACLLLLAPSARGQDLNQLRREFELARSGIELAVRELNVYEGRWEEAYDSIQTAKRRQDDGALEMAYARAHGLSDDRSLAKQAEDSAASALDEARRRLEDGINREIRVLELAMDTATVSHQEEIDLLIEGLERELVDLQRGEEFRIQTAAIALITIDPIDLPEDIIAKAELLERRARQAQETIDDLDERLVELNDRLRRERRRRDSRRSIERFDDNRIPVGDPAQAASEHSGDPGVASGDSTVVQRPVTIEEQIRALETLRFQFVRDRDEFLGRARSFRARAREIR
jgi:hypothetical protein